MQTADFDYNLPEELIAQTPIKNRANSRLLALNRKTQNFSDHIFFDIIDYLTPGDALVLNETKVLPARIFGTKLGTGGAVELLLLKDLGHDTWECLARPGKRLHQGTKITFGTPINTTKNVVKSTTKTDTHPNNVVKNTTLQATVVKTLEEGIIHVKFTYEGIFLEILDRLGTMPLPPYIHKQLEDQSRYQTVYARNLGSAAAPTAGLHFTPKLLRDIEQKGIKIIKITLHVGLGTFRPVSVEDVTKHQMHTENYYMSKQAADTLNDIRAQGGKIFAVGTTTVRTLETVMQKYGKFQACTGDTDIFIYPGYQFQGTDAIITNFHLPKSTLLMLVSAFADRGLILKAYQHAIDEKYRFFSFGDAMLII
ncbi:tRNA preQ1(34) S-adenosylmethionine ribosyltransferase-isomerase QueA [Candidatus Saccharibacteria bacterium]|nr:tRNA preQ1(34) S-adenosylmethionine ribosyltransferase-isomerase QueA [Candidatus Saccharibacteria bacterium]